MITVSAQIEAFGSRADKSWKLVLGTQELTPYEIGSIGAMQNQVAFVAINPDPFTSEQKEIIENTKVELAENGKTPSQRLRGVLYIAWTQNEEGFKTFTEYYNSKLETIITHFKSKLS